VACPTSHEACCAEYGDKFPPMSTAVIAGRPRWEATMTGGTPLRSFYLSEAMLGFSAESVSINSEPLFLSSSGEGGKSRLSFERYEWKGGWLTELKGN
jgi:hypothetical protein